MAKRKWYVVTIGRKIGVFSTWLEVCPLVQGVSGASHQSFSSEAEAYRMFAVEQAKGNTKIVDQPEDELMENSARRTDSYEPMRVNVSAPPGSPAELTIVHQEHQYEEPSRKFKVPVQVRPVHSPVPSPVSRSASEPSPKTRRMEILNSFFKQEKQEPSSPTRCTQISTPKSGSAILSSPQVIVKTPSWVPSYPKALPESQVLSPLDNPKLLLHSFKDSRHASPTQSVRSHHKAGEPHSATTPESSIYVPSPLRPATTTEYMHDVDPRSPIVMPSQTETMSMNSLSFARLSPSVRQSELPANYSHTDMSMLFRPNPAIAG
ncbi:hypothetical protein BDN70DRAFT_556339 [Pholiota conissans]|uniref:Ribonuclease H1 N-terminal domain-containing protein n=1 Tax=Pholiota conissans TaxID=109636 RepID=A0A9P6CTH3_9AGAR|nr:hypothetical protein BDN70DRAFT_556339 [Pholiota conissans]